MNSQKYWNSREKKWQEQQIKDDKARMAEIKKRLQDAQYAIQKEIDANWDRFVNGQKVERSEAMKRASELDVKAFARKAKKYVKEKEFSPTANKELKLYNLTMRINRLELLKANIGLELIATFDELDKYFSNELTQAGLTELRRQAGILEMTIPESGYGKLVQQIIDSSFRVSDFPTFSDNLWQYMAELKADLDKLLVRSITQGRNPKQLAPELSKYLTDEGRENTKYNTQRLMVTETTRVQIGIQEQSYLDAGIIQYEYIAEPTACKKYCHPLDGKVFEVEDMEPGKNAPNMHPWCRCSTAPRIENNNDHSVGEKGLSGKNRIGNNDVDLKYIDSSEFRSKFTRLTENSKVNDKLRRYAQAMLTHRNGNDGEDLYIINASTGELIKRKFGADNELGVLLTKSETEALRKYRENLVAIHNHPTNVYPTGSDYAAAGYRGYKVGVVVTHDGRVFKYSAGNKPFHRDLFDKRVEKYQEAPYNLDIEKAFKRTTEEIGREYGIKCEEI